MSRKKIHFIVSGSFKDPLSCDCNDTIGARDLQCWRLVHERHEGQFADHSETRRLLPRHEGVFDPALFDQERLIAKWESLAEDILKAQSSNTRAGSSQNPNTAASLEQWRLFDASKCSANTRAVGPTAAARLDDPVEEDGKGQNGVTFKAQGSKGKGFKNENSEQPERRE